MKKEKICLVGYGYWGKILHKNLNQTGYKNVKVIDKVLENYHELTEDYDAYFISTPFKDHKEILNHISTNFSDKRVWCEKPLVDSWKDAIEIYKSFEIRRNLLFVDWTYTFNPCVEYLKSTLKNKRLKQIILNRTNNGPVRTDANSILDLSTHDLSILYFLFGTEETFLFHWNEFSLDTTKKIGSNLSWCFKDDMQIVINSSWQHSHKNRVSVFITDDDRVIVFDDVNKVVVINGEKKDFSKEISPLHSAINNFFYSDDFEQNKKITLKISETLDYAI